MRTNLRRAFGVFLLVVMGYGAIPLAAGGPRPLAGPIPLNCVTCQDGARCCLAGYIICCGG